MRLNIFLGTLLLATTESFAAGGSGGHGSITDLIPPAVNVFILVAVLVWKLKQPLADYFSKKSLEISNTMERASLKAKEAHLMLENENRKVENLSHELKMIHQHAENEVSLFEKNLSKETEDKIQKLKYDADLKIKADKKSMMADLNSELLNQVILKTKSTISQNKDYQTKVSTKLLQGL